MKIAAQLISTFNASFSGITAQQFESACSVVVPKLLADWGTMESVLDIIRLDVEGEMMLTGNGPSESLFNVITRMM